MSKAWSDERKAKYSQLMKERWKNGVYKNKVKAQKKRKTKKVRNYFKKAKRDITFGSLIERMIEAMINRKINERLKNLIQ